MFSANEEGSYVHAHTIVLGAPPRADCRRVCAMNFRRRLYSHQPIAVNSLAHCRSNVLTSYESRTQARSIIAMVRRKAQARLRLNALLITDYCAPLVGRPARSVRRE